jgi:hypothetical protein
MPFISNESFVEYIRGKTVALVGPGESASHIEQGSLIDGYDFVARVKSYYIPADKIKYYGKRVDFLYTDNHHTNDIVDGDSVSEKGSKRNITIHPDNVRIRNEILKNKVKVVISTTPQAEWFFNRSSGAMNSLAGATNVRILPDFPYMEIRKITNRPNAGFSAIIDLVSLPFSEIYITGIDFYRSLYRDNYLNSLWTKETVTNMLKSPDGCTPDGKPDFHDPDLQFAYFKKKMYNKDSRIKVDENFKKFLDDPFYEKFENCLVSK